MSLTLKVPTHLDGRNPLVGRYTARELVPVVAGVFAAAGVLSQPHLPPPTRIGEALAVVALGSATGLARPRGRSLAVWGRLAVTHLLGERVSTWAPPSSPPSPAFVVPPSGDLRPPHLARVMGASTPAPAGPPSAPSPRSGGTPRSGRRPATPAHPFVPVEIAVDTIAFADGRRCAVLECSGVAVEGLDLEQQQALHAAYHAFLLGLAFPVQMLLCADPVDLGPYAARRTARLAGHPLAMRRLGSADAAYMRRSLALAGALDQRVYVVIPAAVVPASSALAGASPLALLQAGRRRAAAGRVREQVAGLDRDAANRLLIERCAAIREGLASVGVHAWRLDTPALRQFYYRRLCPRTARVQPCDPAYTAPATTARVLFDQVAPTDNDESEEDDDERDDVGAA